MMRCSVHSMEKTLFDAEARRVTLRTALGETTILQDHLPIVSTIVSGPVVIEDSEGNEHRYKFRAGFLEVRPESQGVVLLES